MPIVFSINNNHFACVAGSVLCSFVNGVLCFKKGHETMLRTKNLFTNVARFRVAHENGVVSHTFNTENSLSENDVSKIVCDIARLVTMCDRSTIAENPPWFSAFSVKSGSHLSLIDTVARRRFPSCDKVKMHVFVNALAFFTQNISRDRLKDVVLNIFNYFAPDIAVMEITVTKQTIENIGTSDMTLTTEEIPLPLSDLCAEQGQSQTFLLRKQPVICCDESVSLVTSHKMVHRLASHGVFD